MAMKSASSKLTQDMQFGQRLMLTSTPDGDMKANIDYTIGTLNIAYRTRRLSVNKYGEISIRNSRASGAKTERQKILCGECKSQLFIWEFQDVWVICTLTDVLNALRDNKGYIKPNNDKITSAYYIPIKAIRSFIIRKEDSAHSSVA